MITKPLWLALLPILAIAPFSFAGDPKAPVTEPETKTPPPVSIKADFRFRYEYRDQEPLLDSHAGTLRGRIGLLTREFAGFQAFAEYEGTVTADRDSYRAASVHGPAGKTIIADPESHELNQAWVSYSNWDSKINVGRQRLILDKARFIGNVGWRQNEQTYDAVTLVNNSVDDVTLTYGYINRVNRIFGSGVKAAAQEDFEGDSHVANLKYSAIPNATIGVYAYFLDLHNDAGDANSNNTFGAYISGAIPLQDSLKLTYHGEYAYQTDAFDSPLDYNTNYYHVKTGVDTGKFNVGVGYENLGSDSGVGFKTPLATLHGYNGFADKFLATPAGGLADLYVYAGTKVKGIGLSTAYHWFGSEAGSLEYGSEIDFVISKKISDKVTFVNKYAFYFADDFATDTNQISAEINIKF